MIRLFEHYMPYAVPFLALDDLLRIKKKGVHERDDSVFHQVSA